MAVAAAAPASARTTPRASARGTAKKAAKASAKPKGKKAAGGKKGKALHPALPTELIKSLIPPTPAMPTTARRVTFREPLAGSPPSAVAVRLRPLFEKPWMLASSDERESVASAAGADEGSASPSAVAVRFLRPPLEKP